MIAELWIGAVLFVCVMASVTLVGYLFLRPAGGGDKLSVTQPSMGSSSTALLGLFRSIGESFPGATEEKNPRRKQLLQAGFRWPAAVPVFYGCKAASALLLAALVGCVCLAFGNSLSRSLLPAICGAAFGFMLPDRILTARIRARARALRSGLPSALDLMVLGMEAGRSLDQTIADSSRGLKATHPDLSAELFQMSVELRAGNSRSEAFRGLAARNQEPELRKLSSLLIDSDRFGTTLGPALRTHAKYLRTRFRQQAQEAARKVGAKLVFPIFFLIFPSVLLVTLGPACIMMYQQLHALLK
jgi:tight adherence protein C